MAPWHRSKTADLGLRLLGAILCAVAYLALSRLVALQQRQTVEDSEMLRLGLATVGVVTASAGGALASLGNHLFDEIEVAARWCRRDIETRPLHDAAWKEDSRNAR